MANELTPIQRFKNVLNAESVQEQFRNALKEGAPLFVASLIDIYTNDKNLQECPPQLVIMEALKAATLKLPINKNLGFAYIVPYKDKGTPTPQFQLGYKGYIQLAQRTAQYKYINADIVYEGELRSYDKLTGELDLNGEAQSDKIVGYFAYIETVNGFRKPLYWTKEQVLKHAKRYSKSFSHPNSPWKSNFDEMALKTMLRNLLSKYGVMSVEMMGALNADVGDERSFEAQAQDDIDAHANSEVIDVEATSVTDVDQQPQADGEGGPGF